MSCWCRSTAFCAPGKGLHRYQCAAIAATYGSISAVTLPITAEELLLSMSPAPPTTASGGALSLMEIAGDHVGLLLG